MEAVFLKIVNMSLTASWLVLAVLLIRFVFRKAPRWIFCLLWGMVAIRLICPFSLESALSLIPSSEPLPEEIIYTATPNIESGIPAVDKAVNPILSENLTTEGFTSANPTQIWSFILAHLWIIGVGIMILYATFSYLLLKRRMQTATLYRKNMKQSELVDSPFVLGVFHPVIYLPYDIDEEDLEYVIAHEQAHIRRKDYLWKPAGFLLLSIYWFNPFIWIAYIFLCRDIEAACDEKVIKEMDREDLRAYSTALLNCSVHRRRIMACPIAFGEVGVKARVKNVMSYKKPAFWIVLLAAAASIIAGICLLTDPLNDKNTKLMGAEYLIEEVLYAVTIGDEVSRKPPHLYGITPDYQLYYQNGGNGERVLLGTMEPYNLTKRELNNYMPVDVMRKNANVSEITDSYILRVENDNFYLAFQTKSGNTYLGYGWEDVSERGQGASDDTRLGRLYLLENRFVENAMYGDYFNYFLKNLLGMNADTFAYRISNDFKGYAIIGFMANGTQQSDMTDMGFAVLQMDSEGRYRLLDYHVYENAAILGNGIYYCGHVAVMDAEGNMEPDKTYDVILSCNSNLQRIERTYIYNEDENSLNHSKRSIVNCDDEITYEMILFGWELEEHAICVSQVMYDKDGNEILDLEIKPEVYGQQAVGKQLTLEDVIHLSEKGEDLSWEDFELYSYYVTGSGLYIREYEIDDRFTLSIGGNYPYDQPGEPDKPYYDKPMYIYLSVEGVVNHRIDIRYEDTASFIEKYKTDPLEELLETIMSAPAHLSNPADYIDAHPAEFKEITNYGAYAIRYFL